LVLMKKESRKKTGLPVISLVLMGIFLVGGSIMLLIQWPSGPANLDWGVWILAYFGYAYLIAAAIFYVKTDR
jgi:hypothetical protein